METRGSRRRFGKSANAKNADAKIGVPGIVEIVVRRFSAALTALRNILLGIGFPAFARWAHI